MKILVAYDGSDAARDALSLAKTHARAFNGKLYVVMSLEGGDENTLEEIEEARTDLAWVEGRLREEGIPAETHLLIRGRTAGEDIVEFAEEQGADEIVTGLTRKSLVGKFLFGSTTQHIIMKARCPVVVVK